MPVFLSILAIVLLCVPVYTKGFEDPLYPLTIRILCLLQHLADNIASLLYQSE